MTFGAVYTMRNSNRRRLLSRFSSLITVKALTSIIPLGGRGHTLICRNLGHVGSNDHRKVRTLGGTTNISNGGLNTNKVSFALTPHVGTTNEVNSTVATFHLLLDSSRGSTTRLTGAVSACGGRHRDIRGRVAGRTVTRVRDHPSRGCTDIVIISNRG